MTFEGTQIQGSAKIMEKIQSLTFQKIAHQITAVDCQPTFDGGILINVLGQLKVTSSILIMIEGLRSIFVQTDDDPPHGFTHTFALKTEQGAWFVQHEIFRMALHNV